MEAIRNFADVKSVVVNDEAADGHETVLDIYFDDYGTVLEDTPRIAEMAGVLEAVTYNYELLAMYLIRSPRTWLRLLFPMFIIIMIMKPLSP